MNILIYVITMLMLLSVLTYSKMDSFRTLIGFSAGFQHYMQVTERKQNNDINETLYDAIHVRKKPEEISQSMDSGKPPKKTVNKNSPRISWHLLLNQPARENNPEGYAKTRELLKQLFTSLYKEQPFFKEFSEKRPNFLDQILDEVVMASEGLVGKNKITSSLGLSTLEFNDPELHYVFNQMMKGIPALERKNDESSQKLIIQNREQDIDDELDSEMAASEDSSKAGYASIVGYTTVEGSNPKVRVFLASRPVLMAIYGDAQYVDKVIESRELLFKRVRQTGMNPVEATEQFQGEASGLGQAAAFASILDFSVTNTDPKSYTDR